jgi:hypothetical protein
VAGREAQAQAGGVIRLTELVGAPVRDASGKKVGRVTELLAGLEGPYPAVQGVMVGRRRHAAVRFAASDFDRIGPGGLDLKEGARTSPSAGEELHLARDVLDVRLVDVDSTRIARAGEVDMAISGGQLRVMALEVGWRAIARRLGMRRLARGIERDSVDWAAVHLASGRGRTLQLSSPHAAVHRLDPDELAELLAVLPVTAGSELLGSVASVRSAAALAALHPDLGADLVESLDVGRAAKLVGAMSDEEAARALLEADPERRAEVLQRVEEPRASRIEEMARRAAAGGLRPRRRFWDIHRGHGRRA